MSSVDYESLIVSIPDYPEPGVIFKDITPLFAEAQGMAAAIDDIADHFINKGITKVVGAPVAYRLNAGFVPARKPGKLPREVYSQTYALEYGTDELQIHKDALTPDDRVLIVDDLVATGGTAVATAELVEKSGAKVAGFSFMLELTYLHPREEIAKKYDEEVFTLIQVQ